MDKNKLICDVETGVCGTPEEGTMQTVNLEPMSKKYTIYYVTDPICSHCWAFEPVLKTFLEQYGQYFNFHIIMGGLLESWEGFADVKNGINKPTDVALHWKEVGQHSRMPIDGSLWLDNPIESSFPASRVFKIIQQKDEKIAHTFLRRAKEAVFAFNQNIGEDKILEDIVNDMGLDGGVTVRKAELSPGKQLLEQDFALAKSLGARGFSTVIMVNKENEGVKIVGVQSLDHYKKGLEQIMIDKEKLQAKPVPKLSCLLKTEKLLFSREVEELYSLEKGVFRDFVQSQLSSHEYQINEILNELYIKER